MFSTSVSKNRLEIVEPGEHCMTCFQACHARISAPGAQLGLPELQLGVIPGFGGSYSNFVDC